MATLTPEQAAFLTSANFAVLATTRSDGSAHASPVWIDYDGSAVVVNTVAGRAKWKHLVRDARATVVVSNPENPYEYVEISGPVELTGEGADEHINAMAKKYLGLDDYPYRVPGEQRVIARLTPERITHYKP